MDDRKVMMDEKYRKEEMDSRHRKRVDTKKRSKTQERKALDTGKRKPENRKIGLRHRKDKDGRYR